jgi:putative ABC transport system permease protein
MIQLAPPLIDRLGVNALGRARLVFDGVLLILAVLDVLLLVQRGLGDQAPGIGADPLLTATPLVLSAAGCALALRLLPPALDALGRIVRRGRGAVALIGRANSARVGARFLPVFATMTGIAIALFASSILATQQQGLHDAGVGQIGADIRISAGSVSESGLEKLRALPGVAELAVVKTVAGVRAAGHSENFAVVVVDARQLAAVEADLSPQKHRFPLLGTERGGRPVAYGGGFLKPLGGRTTLQGGLPRTVSMIEESTPAPKFVSSSPWVLLDERAVPAAERDLAVQESVLMRVTPGDDPDRVVRDVRTIIGPGPIITSALAQVRGLTASPLVAGLTTVALTAIALSVLFSVLALALALLMNAAARAALLARLRALGFARRQAIGLIGWELGPMVVLGAIAGAVLGILVALLFLAVVDLSTFVGGDTRPIPALDPVLAIESVAAFVVVAAGATLVTALAATGPLSSARRTRELDPS